MSTNGLIDKLLISGAAEKSADEIRFTNGFISHLAVYSEYIRSRGAALNLWREIFCSFDATLRSLDDEEVRTVIVFLGYFLEKAEAGQGRR